MAYCGPIGLRHSKFLKWPEADRDKALSWLVRNHSRCDGCGVPKADLDPAQGGNPQAYKVKGEICPVCRAADALKASTKAFGDEQRWGMRVQIVPNDDLSMWQIGR